jgi:hypothetical protein
MVKKDFPIFDCDSHVVEPPEIWDEYVPSDIRSWVKTQFHFHTDRTCSASMAGRCPPPASGRMPRRWGGRAGAERRQPTMDSQGVLEDYTKSFKLRAYETLIRQARRFRVCTRCRRPFIARKRQAYCEKKCSQSVRTRKYRAAHRQKVNALRMKGYYAKSRKAPRWNAQNVDRAEHTTATKAQQAPQGDLK